MGRSTNQTQIKVMQMENNNRTRSKMMLHVKEIMSPVISLDAVNKTQQMKPHKNECCQGFRGVDMHLRP